MKAGSCILWAALILLCSCNSTKHREAAEAAVAEFRTRLDTEQYHTMYAMADDAIRKAASEADFIALMQLLHQKLGKVQQSHLRYYADARATGVSGPLLTLVYNTRFAGGAAVERFVWHIRDQRAVLYEYNVNSDALKTK